MPNLCHNPALNPYEPAFTCAGGATVPPTCVYSLVLCAAPESGVDVEYDSTRTVPSDGRLYRWFREVYVPEGRARRYWAQRVHSA